MPARRRNHRLAAATALAALTAAAGAFPVEVPLDPDRSEVTVTLTVPIGSDSDTSPLDGFVLLDVDDLMSPGQLSLLNYRVDVLEDIDLDISAPFLGGITAQGRDLAFFYAVPGVPDGPVRLIGSEFEFLDVPTLAEGEVEYDATGVVCSSLQAEGLPCEDTIDLADSGQQSADRLAGEFLTRGLLVTITSEIDVTVPLDPDNPDLGSFHVEGTLVGEVTVPRCPGDLTGDDATDVADFFAFLDGFAAGDLSVADIDRSGDVNVNDLFLYLDLFSVGCF